ncbi:MAG: hypothetical protein JST00_30245 [Deltaproteobacteria bacterium]|nr:hypothetical protein [Deltaproteobacteria bacterium]
MPWRVGLACLFASLALGACSSGEESVDPTPPAAEPPAPPPPAPPAKETPLPVEAGAPEASAPEPLDVPAALVKALDGKSYVEERCESTTVPGWPHAAQRCTYRTNLVVTIANPPADRVAKWIVDASTLVAAVDALHTRDRASWEAALLHIAKHTIGQSSRIFPLSGKVWENGTAYEFERGVTKTCGTGCYCRINSTSRQQWCKYAVDVAKTEASESACLTKYGQPQAKLTEPWLARCLDNHIASWGSDRNEHYRAQAHAANAIVSAKVKDPKTATGADVLAALKDAYPLY